MGAEAPGQALLSERELCTQLDVSRDMLREAIKVLAGKGLVESRPKLGTVVRERRAWNLLDPDVLAWHCEIGADDWFLRNVAEMRLIVESGAARLAAANATDVEIARLTSLCNRLRIAIHDAAAFAAADAAFHAALAAAAHNELLEQLLHTIGAALRGGSKDFAACNPPSEATFPLHAAVVEGLRARDGGAAEAAARALLAVAAPGTDGTIYDGDEAEPAVDRDVWVPWADGAPAE